jgi:septal ring factor EnvC (AmiA/AmiB activator)
MSDNPTRETPDSRSFEERVFARFDTLDERTGRLETKVDALDGRLTTLEEKVDSRLRETRPIWEAVLARLTTVEERVGGVETEVRQVRRTMRAMHEDILRTRVEQAGLDDDIGKLNERVEKLESQSTP